MYALGRGGMEHEQDENSRTFHHGGITPCTRPRCAGAARIRTNNSRSSSGRWQEKSHPDTDTHSHSYCHSNQDTHTDCDADGQSIRLSHGNRKIQTLQGLRGLGNPRRERGASRCTCWSREHLKDKYASQRRVGNESSRGKAIRGDGPSFHWSTGSIESQRTSGHGGRNSCFARSESTRGPHGTRARSARPWTEQTGQIPLLNSLVTSKTATRPTGGCLHNPGTPVCGAAER
jgi:hypothetical protein